MFRAGGEIEPAVLVSGPAVGHPRKIDRPRRERAIGGERFVAAVDDGEARRRRDDGRDHRQCILEIAIAIAVGPADLLVVEVHEDEAAGLQLGHTRILRIEAIGAGRAAGDDAAADAVLLDHRLGLDRLGHVAVVRSPRAWNGVVCAACPSYDCRPSSTTFGNELIIFASLTAGRPGSMPVRPKYRSINSLIGSPPAAAPLIARTFCSSSTTNIVSGALRASAMARAILSLPTTAVVISRPRIPCSANTSASLSRAAQMPTAPASISARRNLRALVRLAVRPEPLVPRLQMRGHLPDVVFEGVEVEQEGRGRDVAAKLHERRMLTGSWVPGWVPGRFGLRIPASELQPLRSQRVADGPRQHIRASRVLNRGAHVIAELVHLGLHRLEIIDAARGRVAGDGARREHRKPFAIERAANRALVADAAEALPRLIELRRRLLGRADAAQEFLFAQLLTAIALAPAA